MTEKRPETALRDTQGAERGLKALAHQILRRMPLTDEGLLGALRDAGWVDPEEAARLRSDYWRAREDRSQFMGERDALLPVVEAARALIDTWDNTSMVDPDDHQIQAGYVSLMSGEDSRALEDAFDRVSQLVGEPLGALDSGSGTEVGDG